MKYFSKPLRFLLKAGVSLGFIMWLVLKVRWGEVWGIVRDISVASVALYVALLLVGIGISVYKWRIIARSKSFDRSWSDYFWTYLSGTFINNFLPGFVGGDAYRSYWLGREGKRYTAAASTVVMDRLTGLLAAMVLAFGCSLLRLDAVVASPLWLFLDVAMACVLVAALLWRWIAVWSLVQSIIKLVPSKLRSFLSEFGDERSNKEIVRIISLALAFNVVGVGLANLTLFVGLDSSFVWKDYFAVIFLISIISSIPISINNIGVKEWAYVTFFGLFGMRPELAVTVALLSRAIQMLVSFTALPVYLKQKQNHQ